MSEEFKLCKEVYERLGWDGTDKYYCQFQNHSSPEDCRHIVHTTIETVEEVGELQDRSFIYQLETTPLYTSDYLLYKLKTGLGARIDELVLRWDVVWTAYFYPDFVGGEWCEVQADTPLLALLKLTIALHEAGELS